MSSSLTKPYINPKLFGNSTAQLQESNQKIYYSNKMLEIIKKQDNLKKEIVKKNAKLNAAMLTQLSNQVSEQSETIQQLKTQIQRYESLQDQMFEQIIKKNEMKNPVASLLTLLPCNYPIGGIFINGKQQKVTKFLSVNLTDQIALFLDGEHIKSFDIKSIDGIIWV